MKYKITNAQALLPDALVNTNIDIEDGRISKISKNKKTGKSVTTIDAGSKYVIPGFIDLHTNGIAGFDLTNGLYDKNTNRFSISKPKYFEGLDTALTEYAMHGTTLVGFTTLEASEKKMKKIFSMIAEYLNESESHVKSIFHGIYMEGTFMKDKKFKGAHNPKYFNKPSVKLFKKFQKAAGGNIKIVNVVPEWGKDAIKLIEHLVKNSIVCAAGHTSATGKQYYEAINKGLNLAVHVLNGPSSSSFKPFEQGGALEAFLSSDEMYVEIIPDGYHVNKSYLLDIISRKSIEKCIAISDSMFVTNMKALNEFKINGVAGKVSKNREYIQIAGEENSNALYGSILTMDTAFNNLLTWFTKPINGIWNKLHAPLDFEHALINASKMCSENPAKVLGLFSNTNLENSTGSIEENKSADLIIADIKKVNDNYKLSIDKVILGGKPVYSNSTERKRI